jgi:hypothetical protein
VGQHQTLPADQHGPPRTRQQARRADEARDADQLEADTVPYTYYAKVIANQRPHERDEPLGRRTPEPLDTRQGVER